MRLILMVAMLTAAVTLALGVGASVATGAGGADGCTSDFVLTPVDSDTTLLAVDDPANGGNGNGYVCVDPSFKKGSTKPVVVDDNPPKEKKKH